MVVKRCFHKHAELGFQASLGFTGLWKQKERTMLLTLGVSQLHLYNFFSQLIRLKTFQLLVCSLRITLQVKIRVPSSFLFFKFFFILRKSRAVAGFKKYLILILFIIFCFSFLHSTSFRYGNTDMALHYGAMLRECIRHQTVAR